MSNQTIHFFDAHQPVLQDGHYRLDVTQSLAITGSTISTPPQANTLDFYVAGPRFAFDPSLVHSVFPPHGGKGDYRACFPSLVLTRSTLPWERSPIISEETDASWLFLLLLDQSEIEAASAQTPAAAVEHNNAELSHLSQYFSPPLSTDELSRLPEKINYLELDSSLQSLFPSTLEELNYLSYARIKGHEEEHAVILCNRLPVAGHNSTAYLVSLENRYSKQGSTSHFNWPNQGKLILPYLYKWDFYSFDEQLYCITEHIADKVEQNVGKAEKPDLSSLYDQLFQNTTAFTQALTSAPVSIDATNADNKTLLANIKKLAKLPGSTFHGLLSNLSGGFAPLTLTPTSSTAITSTGTVQLPYNKPAQQTGATQPAPTHAWYRGPLVASTIDLSKINPSFPFYTQQSANGHSIKNAPGRPDDLLIVDRSAQCCDTSYSAAFELGRLMALDDVSFATQFYQWKHDAATAIRANALNTADSSTLPHLPQMSVPAMPQNLIDKFKAWQALKGIPYRYLLADPKLLPNESIRYFYLDNHWVNAFTCGAFSIGHTVAADLTAQLDALLLPATFTSMGFLINSLAVSGWPNFEVDVHFANAATSTVSHQKDNNLAINIALFLFDQPFTQLGFHLHPAKVHSGLLYEDGTYQKQLNPPLGNTTLTLSLSNQTIQPSAIADSLSSNDVAHFAAAMLEGEAIVDFTIGT